MEVKQSSAASDALLFPCHFQERRGSLRRARLWCLGLVLCLCMVNIQPAAAQEPAADLQVQQLRIQVMPEFDDPRVLVIVQGRLAVPDVAFPMSVTFRVPRGAQINQMVAMDVTTGATRSQPFDIQSDPDDARWSLVTYTLDNAHFFYEYYYNPLVGETDKQFTFTFSSLQPVVDLLLEVQQPLAATDFTLDPAPTIVRFDEALGFTYHRFSIGTLAAGGETLVKVSYTKTDPAPSLSREQSMTMQMGSPPADTSPMEETSRASSTIPTWVFVLLGSGLLATIGGFIWYRTRPGSAPRASAPEIGRGQFCHQCGTALKANARFCHVCGASSKAGLGRQTCV